MSTWMYALLQGVLLGGLYALYATGLSLAFGIMRLVNIAHGDLIVLGAYLALIFMSALGVDPLVALPLVVVLMAAMGYVLQRLVLNRTLGRDILPPLLVTFGLSIVIENVLLQGFSADTQHLASPIQTASLQIGTNFAVGWLPVMTLLVAVALVALLEFLFSHTKLGRSFRATSDDPEIASLMGVNPKHLYGLAMAVSMAVIAIAAILFGMRTSFTPTDGPAQLLFAFEVVIMGGMGSLWGTLAGGVILGVSQAIGFQLNPGWGVLAGHLVFLALLVLRPEGLFPRTRDA